MSGRNQIQKVSHYQFGLRRMDETKMRGDFDSSPFASPQVNTHHLKRAWKSDSGAQKKKTVSKITNSATNIYARSRNR